MVAAVGRGDGDCYGDVGCRGFHFRLRMFFGLISGGDVVVVCWFRSFRWVTGEIPAE